MAGPAPGFQSTANGLSAEDSPLLGGNVTIQSDDPDAPQLDPKSGALIIPSEDGGVVVQFNPPRAIPADGADEAFYANLAERLSDGDATQIVEIVLSGIEADDQSRQEWLQIRARGEEMLGLKLEAPQNDAGNGVSPFEGMANVKHPLLAEAVVNFQATASGELYPPSGCVKVRDDRPVKPAGALELPMLGHNGGPPLDGEDPSDAAAVAAASRAEVAEALERGFNHNLTTGDRGYRPDSVRMLFSVGFGGCAFKKVYDCPIREMPISRFVDAKDLIVSNDISDLSDAGRITHRITMRRSVMRRMQIAGVYRDVDLTVPAFQPDAIEEARAQTQGLTAQPQRPEDQLHTVYECYCELDVPGHEHKRNGQPTGLPLPFKVTIDKDSRQLLELRRNWEEDDETYRARRVFVKFGFVPAMGFYDIGLLHLLGNGQKALTAAWCEALDAGMFCNFPGFLYNETMIRNWTNQNRVPPGGGLGIKVNGNLQLDQVVKPLPYKDVSPGHIAFIEHVEQRMDRLAGSAQVPVAEGRQDAPVGTTLAMIEQATKVLSAVHIGLHASLAEELQLLKERYRANPASFWKWNKRGHQWEEGLFLRALEDNEIVPASDPNTPSHMIRIMRAWAVVQIAQMAPSLFPEPQKAARRFFEMIGIADSDEFLGDPNQPPRPPPPNPAIAMVQQRAQETQQKAQVDTAKLQQQAQENAAEHQLKMAQIQAHLIEGQQDRAVGAEEVAAESADRAATRVAHQRIEAERLQGRELHPQGLAVAPPLPAPGEPP